MRSLSALTLLVLTLAACGDDAPSDEQQVRSTLQTFATSIEERDYQTLCDEVFAPGLLQGLQQIGLPCEVAMRTSLGEVDQPKLTVGEVSVEKTTARAEIRTSAQGQQPSSDTIELTKVGERWQVSALGGDPEPTASATASATESPARTPSPEPSPSP